MKVHLKYARDVRKSPAQEHKWVFWGSYSGSMKPEASGSRGLGDLSLQSECEIPREIQQMEAAATYAASGDAPGIFLRWHTAAAWRVLLQELVSCSRLHWSGGSHRAGSLRGSGTLCGTWGAEADTREKDHGRMWDQRGVEQEVLIMESFCFEITCEFWPPFSLTMQIPHTEPSGENSHFRIYVCMS